MRGEPMSQQGQVRVSVRMPAAHAAALEQKAEREDRTLSAEIRRIVRRYIETLEKGPEMA
jgi:predicted DNA-binding protein